MDTHKDFIHIDDVFKDLRNGEEPEPSGAWMRMKDLLDKEMPAGAPVSAGKSFRRYIIPLVALLLAGGGFTYYKMNQDSKDNATLNPSTSVIAGKTTGNDKASHLNSGNNTDAMHGISIPEAGNVPSGAEKNNNINNVGRHTSANNIPANNKNNSDHTIASGATASHTSTNRKGNGASNKNNLTATTKQNNNIVASNNASSKLMEEQRVIEEIKPTPGAASTNSNLPAVASNTTSVSAINNTNPAQSENTFGSNNNPKKIAAV